MVLRVALAASLLAACGFDADFGGTDYMCRGECPEGQTCVGGVCRSGGTEPIDGGPDAQQAIGYAAAVLADEPILYLRLDEVEGEVAMDSSGAGRHGTYQLGTSHDADGVVGGAVHCDGVSGRITVPDDDALRLNGDWTIELWVKLDEVVNAFPGLVSKGGADEVDASYIIYYSADRIPVLKRAGTDGIGATAEPLSTSGYRYYALVYDQSEATATWYVDGDEAIARGDLTWPDNDNISNLSFGRGDQYGKQWLDEIAVYDVPLSADQVEAHVAAAKND